MNNSRKLFFYGIFAVVAVSATFGTVYASHNSSITNLIGDTGSVGIGTITPTSHMSGVDSSYTNLIGDTGSVGIGTITPTLHRSGYTNLIGDTGSVGIGTTTPTAELEVVGDIKLSGSLVSDENICIGTCDSTPPS
ncbi:MAG: hypothetical protein J4F36_13540 [Nitrosopumilaceae archaeon]|nr:hypothetical protein [Nitrosopumilaceae archaeon]